MAQYDVHRNPSDDTSPNFPYLLEVQSNVFEDATRAVIVPLIPSRRLVSPDRTSNPAFKVGHDEVTLFPLDIVAVEKSRLGGCVANLATDGDHVVAALKMLFARD